MVATIQTNQTKSDLEKVWKEYRRFACEAKLRNEVEQAV